MILYIESKPRVYIPSNINKPGNHNSNHDIAGTLPRVLCMALKGRKDILSNADIPGSAPNVVKFKTKREPQNPLNPVYKL